MDLANFFLQAKKSQIYFLFQKYMYDYPLLVGYHNPQAIFLIE